MGKVIIEKTKPETVLADYRRLVKKVVGKKAKRNEKIVLKVNLSWTKFFPGCSTPPWQLEGVILGLLDLGVKAKNIIPVENKTVVTDVYKGSKNHYWDKVCRKYGVRFCYLTEEKYVKYKPKMKMMVLGKIFGKGVKLPKIIFDKPILHLPTLKMHVFTTTTGAIKNYFGMLKENRHFAHRYIHEAIIDLLGIQKEIHPWQLGVMDGTIAGEGSGPRAMKWREVNLLLASDDLLALDSIASKIMGFDWKEIDYLRLGEKLGLGKAEVSKIKIEGGVNLKKFNLGFKREDTGASRGQKFIYNVLPEEVEKLLLRTFIAPWSYFASYIYHDIFWYQLIGKRRIDRFIKSRWGKKLNGYKG